MDAEATDWASSQRSYKAVPRRKRLVRRVLRSDPSQEYLLYVPSMRGPDPPMVVSVHGMSRNADEHARLLSAYAEMYGALLVAPHFPEEDHADYQRLGRLGRGKRSDLALNQIVAEAADLADATVERFHLFGFSGGAQFAHRYVMAYPHRIASAALASAGWYTFPDPKRRFPRGIRTSPKLPGVRFDPEDFLRVPIKVFVSAGDDGGTGLRREEWLDQQQGKTRVERARSWVAAMQAAAEAHQLEPAVSYEELLGPKHSFRRSTMRAGLGEKVFEALLGAPPPREPIEEIVLR